MTFITTGLAIAGLLAVSIPIIIHLLWRQRRRPVDWAAMRFLLEAFRKQRKRLRVEQLLLLLTRCLIVLLLGLALARPILQAGGIIEGDQEHAVLIIIDNGVVASVGETPEKSALEAHRQRAKAIVRSLGPSEPVGVVTTASPVDPPVLPASIDHQGVLDAIDAIDQSDSPTDLAGALRAVRSAAEAYEEGDRHVVVYLLSEFRAGSAPLDDALANFFGDNADRFTLLASPPATAPAENIQIVGIDPVRRLILPGANDAARQLTVRLARHGARLERATTRVRLDGAALRPVEPQLVEWAPGASTMTVNFRINFDVPDASQLGITAIAEHDDMLAADNRRFVTLDVRERVRVTMVSPPTFVTPGEIENLSAGQWIRWALQPTEASPMEVVDIAPSNLTEVDLRSADVAIVTRPDRLDPDGWSAFRAFVQRGGLLIFVPPAESNVHPWTDQLQTELNLPWRIALEVETYDQPRLLANEQPGSELLTMLAGELGDLTRTLTVTRALPINTDETQASTVLTFEDNSPLMIVGSPPLDPPSAAQQTSTTTTSARQAPGLVVYLAVTPRSDWTNLPLHMLMVPLFQETVRQGLNIIRAQQGIETGERPVLIGTNRNASALVGPDGSTIALSPLRQPRSPLRRAGLYDVRTVGDEVAGVLAVNIDPHAARTDVQGESAVTNWLSASGEWTYFDPEAPTRSLATTEGGRSIAGILLFLLLALVILETLLARWFSHAHRGGEASSSAGLTGGLRPTIVNPRMN